MAHSAHSNTSRTDCQPVPDLPPDSRQGGVAMAQPSRRPPVMADVSQSAGVSHQVISRMPGSRRTVRNEARAKAMHAIEERGHRRDSSGRALATRRDRTRGAASDTTLHGPSAAPAELRYPFPVATVGGGRVREAPRRQGGPAPRCRAGGQASPGGRSSRHLASCGLRQVAGSRGPGHRAGRELLRQAGRSPTAVLTGRRPDGAGCRGRWAKAAPVPPTASRRSGSPASRGPSSPPLR